MENTVNDYKSGVGDGDSCRKFLKERLKGPRTLLLYLKITIFVWESSVERTIARSKV